MAKQVVYIIEIYTEDNGTIAGARWTRESYNNLPHFVPTGKLNQRCLSNQVNMRLNQGSPDDACVSESGALEQVANAIAGAEAVDEIRYAV